MNVRNPVEIQRRRFLLGVLVLLAVGCGKVGPPQPPPPRGPLAPLDVNARQIGEDLCVEYRVSPARGDQPGQVPVEAEIIRVAFSPGVEPATDADVFRRRGETVLIRDVPPGQVGQRIRDIDASTVLLEEMGVGSTFRYAVRVRDARGRLSPLVAATELEKLPNAPAPTGLMLAPTPTGILLRWEPGSEPLRGVHVYRASPDDERDARRIGSLEAGTATYEDATVELGRRYRYFLRTVLTEGAPLREGADGTVVEIVAIDRFPPEVPTGLVGVQEGRSVRLFWNPNRDSDLSGYRVYRRIDGGDWVTVMSSVNSPTWRDLDVSVGDRWEYRVAALDSADPANESEPTQSVAVDLIAEPVAGAPAEGQL